MNEFLSLFTRAAKLARIAADESMSRHGVRVGQNLVLEALWATDGLTPGEVADRTHLSTPTVVNTANRMVTAGLLTKRRDRADGRLVRLYLTERAIAVQGAIDQGRDELERRMTGELTEAERAAVFSALRKMITALDKPPK